MELVVITGVTRGLGKAMAREFASRGDFVVAGCGRDKDSLAKVQRELGEKHLVSRADITIDSQVEEWSNEVISKYGLPTYLINNAGCLTDAEHYDHQKRMWNFTEADVSSVIDVNLKGTINVLRHFVPGMIENGYGLIVNLTSRWGEEVESQNLTEIASMGPYMASKCGVVALTRSLQAGLELEAFRRGVSFRGVWAKDFNPGTVNTDLWRKSGFGSEQLADKDPSKWATKSVPKIISWLREYSDNERKELQKRHEQPTRLDRG